MKSAHTLIRSVLVVAFAMVAVTAHRAEAALLWGNNAGSDQIDAFDPTTGALVHKFQGVIGNGRGVVVVGSTLYYTITGDGYIHEMDSSTGTLLSTVINTGQSSLSTIFYDGINFYLADYSGTNKAYKVSPTGTVISIIPLASATGYTDGLE